MLGFETLPGEYRATLWPYRPGIRDDELLSGWLWQVAAGIGVPPKRFASDAIGAQLTDVDREIDDAAIKRIAFLSGHTPQQLLRATLRADAPADSLERREHMQRLLLRHGDLVLNRRHTGRSKPMTQYCPVCLGGPDPHLPRGWRFSFEVVCCKDGCFLLDGCWRCGARLDPLAGTVASTSLLCVACGTPFASAPSLRIDETVTDQVTIYERLSSLAFSGVPDFIGFGFLDEVERLSAGDLRGTNPKNAADRHNAVLLEAWRGRQLGAPAVTPKRPPAGPPSTKHGRPPRNRPRATHPRSIVRVPRHPGRS